MAGPTVGGVAPADAATPPTITALSYTYLTGSNGELIWPDGVSVSRGKVYVSNTGENVVSLLSGGNTTTFAGSLEAHGETGDGGPASAATLLQPTQTTEDAAGNVYIADTEDNVIRAVNAHTGVITRVAGNGRAGSSGVSGKATRAELDSPQGVAVNAHGDLFIADTYNERVLEVLPNGTILPYAGDGRDGYVGDGHRATRAELSEPTGLAVDAQGNLYIADSGNNLIRRVDARTHVISTVAGNYAAVQAKGGQGGFGGDGGAATSALLYSPQGVALDGAGDLFIADTFNNAIREVTPSGTISTVVNSAAPAAGAETNGTAAASHLNGPSAVAVDDTTGTVYIADTSNNEVESVTGLAQVGGTHPGPVAPTH